MPSARTAKPDLRAFRKMNEELIAAEVRRDFWPEMVVFALVIGLIAWPLISLFIVLAQTANG